MFDRHVLGELSAYSQNELSASDTRRVEEHLERCGDCRRELDEVAFGIRLAQKLRRAEAPAALWPEVRDGIDRHRPGRSAARTMLAAAAVIVVLAGAVVAWYFGMREPLRVTESTDPPSSLETVAIEEHLRRMSGDSHWQIRTADIPRLRRWVHESSELTADEIPVVRPAEDAGRLRVVGASLARMEGATAALIGYEVDSEPVTLATARLQDLADAPHVAPFSKDVRYRFDREHGYKVVTWGVAHKAYAMVSRLPGYGQKGCFLCHTAPERRRLIDSALVRAN